MAALLLPQAATRQECLAPGRTCAPRTHGGRGRSADDRGRAAGEYKIPLSCTGRHHLILRSCERPLFRRMEDPG